MSIPHRTGKFFILMLLAWPAGAQAQLAVTVHPHFVAGIDDELQQQEQVDEVPGDASLVTDQQWSDQRAATIKDVTDYIPGVIDQPHDGAESNRLSIRGSGLANTFQGRGLLVMQDGIPINTADGEFEFPVIEPWLIRYAEVYPGADALEYGASNFGGAINFITPTGATDPGIDIRGEAGSFDTLHGQVSVGRAWNGGDLFAAVTGFHQDGFRHQNAQDTERFNGNWGWQPSSEFSNRVYISHTLSDAELPGAISLSELHESPRLANPINLAKDYQRNLDITRIADKSAWTDGTNRVDTTLFYTYRHLDNPVTTYEFQHNNDVGMRAKYTYQSEADQWIGGVNTYYGTADEARYQNDNATPGAPILTRNLYALTSETYAQYDHNIIGGLHGVLGAQGSYVTRDIDQFTPTAASQNTHYSGFSPRLGLRYDFKNGSQAFANLSRSFEPPTWSELSGGNHPGFAYLKAQRALTAEIGGRGEIRGMHWQAAYYHGWLNDEFVNYRFADGDTATINAHKSKRDGIEIGFNGDAARDLWVKKDAIEFRAAYTFSHFTLDHDPLYGNNTLPGVPEHYLRAELLYHYPSGISLGPNIEWSPTAYPVDLANTLYAGGYAILGARIFWESEDQRLNFYIEGRNLLNRTYIATTNVIPDASGADGKYFYPGEGRAVYAGFRWRI